MDANQVLALLTSQVSQPQNLHVARVWFGSKRPAAPNYVVRDFVGRRADEAHAPVAAQGIDGCWYWSERWILADGQMPNVEVA